MNTTIKVPVLLIGFNRPNEIVKTFDYIRKAKPQKLYVAIDGSRKDRSNEFELVETVRKIVKDVDWECETHYKFSDENLGAEISVSTAITWVLENEEFVIVLEEDIIAPISFLNFAQEMLIKYANNENVYMISSNQTTPIEMPNNEDYLFGIYGHIWGWATWKRAWSKFDLNIDDYDDVLNSSNLNELVQTKSEKKLWISIIKNMKRKGVGNNTWDICWSYIRFKEKGLSIIPSVNLSSNIGIIGLHTKSKTSAHFRGFEENFQAVNHPKEIKQNIEYDKHHFEKQINNKPYLIKRVLRKMLRILKLK